MAANLAAKKPMRNTPGGPTRGAPTEGTVTPVASNRNWSVQTAHHPDNDTRGQDDTRRSSRPSEEVPAHHRHAVMRGIAQVATGVLVQCRRWRPVIWPGRPWVSRRRRWGCAPARNSHAGQPGPPTDLGIIRSDLANRSDRRCTARDEHAGHAYCEEPSERRGAVSGCFMDVLSNNGWF